MLVGTKILLRPPLDTDRPFLFGLRNDVAVQMQLLVLPRANPQARVDEWITKITSDPAALFFIIAEKSTSKPAGYIQLTRMDFVHGHGELGICLGEAFRGQGIGFDALLLLEEYARDIFHLRKIVLQVADANRRAIQLYEKAGYATVGVLKQHFYQQQAYHDVRLMEKFLVELPGTP